MNRLPNSAQLEISSDARDLYQRMAAGETPTDTDTKAAEHLLALGLLRQDPTAATPPTLVDPRYIGAQWEADLHTYATAMLQQAAALPDLLRDLSAAYDRRPADPRASVLEHIRGSDAINGRLAQILAGAAEELLFCQPGRTRRIELMEEARERDLATLARGVRMRTIYHDDVRAVAGMDGWVRGMEEAGAEIRTVPDDFQRVFIVDRKTAVLPVDLILTDSREAAALIVHDAGVAAFLARDFDSRWERARAWGDIDVHPGLTARHLIVLRELERETDLPAIAARLQVSVRTVNSLIAEIKAALGVSTLFGMACAWKRLRQS